ncbi:MAG: VWA domain-containing protein [Bacteroidota bacterium]|nr:VWA domain-containing protein [Bacteroidota bacterium]
MKMQWSIIVFIATILSSPAWAQPSTRITTMHVIQGQSQAELTLSVKCSDEVQYILTHEQLSITDNGTPVEEFSIVESSSPAVRNPISAALVLDASGSMSGAGNAGAKAAGLAFVGLMDSTTDEAAVFYFNSAVTLTLQMTSSSSSLINAVDGLPAGGATAVWDAIYAGINEVAASAGNSKRAVVALTDGGDNSSTRSPAEVIALAQQKNIRVFTVGLGSAINATTLEMIALLTGGLYYQTPSATELQNIFTTIATFMGRGFDEHTVAFVSPDPDAQAHRLEVRVRVCGDVAEATHSEAAITGVTSVSPAALPAAQQMELAQNAPNPFAAGSGTVIPYTLRGGSARHVTLEVYDLLGRRVATLVDGLRSEGTHTARFAAESLATGLYLYRLSSGENVQTRMMMIR